MRLNVAYGRQLELALGKRPLLPCTRPLFTHHVLRPGGMPPRISLPGYWTRGAKKKSSKKLTDLPQGPLEGEEPYAPIVNDAPQYPTVLQGVKNNMQKFKNCVLLTRVGNFYELYFEHAEEYSSVLSLKLAYKKTNAGLVPMAGFPFFQLDRFLKILVQDLNKYVAISEEFANDVVDKAKSGGLMFDRKVARVVTPGTLIDEKFMDPYQNNFLLSVYIPSETSSLLIGDESTASTGSAPTIGLSWLDLSTGDFFTQQITSRLLLSAIARIGAREIVVDQSISGKIRQELGSLIGGDHQLLTSFSCSTVAKPLSEWSPVFESPVTPESAAIFTGEETKACNMLLEYVQAQIQGLKMKLQPPRRRQLEEAMGIDRNSLRGLEILETARDGLGKGSLLHAVRRTTTKSGARLLRDRLTSPSASLHVINERLDLVSTFLEDEDLREHIILLLKRSYDVQRLVQKFSLGRGDPDDLICLSRAIEASSSVRSVLLNNVSRNNDIDKSIQSMLDRLHLDGPEDLSRRILEAIDEEGLQQKHRAEDDVAATAAALAQEVILNEGSEEDLESFSKKVKAKSNGKQRETSNLELNGDTWIMQRDASADLANLHDALDRLWDEKAELTQKLRDLSGTSTLTLKWTPGLGHIVHMKGAKALQQSLDSLGATRTVSSSKSTRSFYLPAWSRLGSTIDEARLRIRAEEQRIFEELREKVILNLVKLRRNAAVMDELDVACSFATLAQEQQMVRPALTTSTSHKIVGGRHPTVKLGLEEQGRPFVSNDCFLGDKERIWLITGPNMAGKSTFLRQNALITILAQVGSFVPADYAEIGIVDQIFSRIGAADDLFRDQSTFMVEMLETATILKNATYRSFVIMDEVGRGTTPEDGTAVGFACLDHLHNVIKCRTLFATHFHALADMTANFESLSRYCTDIREDGSGSFSFIHKLKKGVNRQSHALKVARLAGLPPSVIDVARDVLQRLSLEKASA
ncbi:hypothetical protein AJ80_07959 [Polytolypa hystricis UAMH7299]|uniref:DNA mismatch repair protein MSH3 n=1 Tax=Polytolypa hystricis (strain UAMH7299) TaxID=1447883 RepID=A0A2B7X7W4_POLH7|nr:hypothetical protein AJ80_07959 [Polytolypa hystricis UAMH7299]